MPDGQPVAPDLIPGVCRACGATLAMMDEFNARTFDAGGPWLWADEGRTVCRPCREEEVAAMARAEVAVGPPPPPLGSRTAVVAPAVRPRCAASGQRPGGISHDA